MTDAVTTERPPREERTLLPAVVVFDVPGSDGTAAARLRRFLKAALRSYGLRCVQVRYATPEELHHAATFPNEDNAHDAETETVRG